MLEIGVREIRHHLGSLLDRVEKGEEIMIIRRGKKIARLTPMADVEPFKWLESIRIQDRRLTKLTRNRKKELLMLWDNFHLIVPMFL